MACKNRRLAVRFQHASPNPGGEGPLTMRGAILFALAIPVAFAQYKALNPQVVKITTQVSEDRITANLKKLESFGTRFLFSSQDHPTRGIGAARRWILAELKSYSPRLEIHDDVYRLKKGTAPRVTSDVDLHNIVAILPGTTHPEQRVMITAHYDTIALAGATGANTGGENTTPAQANPDADAPGVTDDGSGVACVMELARILSQYEFEKTLVFVTFAGEEEGLLGSSLYAAQSKKEAWKIEALLNNDIIGSAESGSGRAENRRVTVFSEDPLDSPPRTVARYVREIGERYVPSLRTDLVFRQDRVGRGGDHTPFALEGFGAVRLSSPQEDYAHQHTAADTFEFTSVPYIAQVTRLNIAVAASLASAPKAPTSFTVGRGTSRYDARLQWKEDKESPDVAGYVVVTRTTTAPYWEHEFFVGKTAEHLFTDVSIDDIVFGVKSIDTAGNESLVTPYLPAPRTKRVVEVVP